MLFTNIKFLRMENIFEIPKMFPGKFPPNFINDVNGWSFAEEELRANHGKLLTLDIDFGKTCGLNCPQCFRRKNKADDISKKEMDYNETISLILSAKKLGLRSVKFLGKGEPFENTRFIEFLRFLKSVDIIPLVFTKGTVFGNDELAKKYNSRYGINNGFALITELKKLNVSILLGFNSFNSNLQDKMVGKVGYTKERNIALLRLIEAGFNHDNPTRLGIINTPINFENCNEAFSIYKWARERNMYPISTTSMVSGCGAKTWETKNPEIEKVINLYTKIYKFNLEKEIQTLEQIINEGISTYAGSCPCNQVACGMYVTLNGTVLRCPGDDVTIFGNIFEQSLEEIWLKSENFQRAGTFNCDCPPKMGTSIPFFFFETTMERVKKLIF